MNHRFVEVTYATFPAEGQIVYISATATVGTVSVPLVRKFGAESTLMYTTLPADNTCPGRDFVYLDYDQAYVSEPSITWRVTDGGGGDGDINGDATFGVGRTGNADPAVLLPALAVGDVGNISMVLHLPQVRLDGNTSVWFAPPQMPERRFELVSAQYVRVGPDLAASAATLTTDVAVGSFLDLSTAAGMWDAVDEILTIPLAGLDNTAQDADDADDADEAPPVQPRTGLIADNEIEVLFTIRLLDQPWTDGTKDAKGGEFPFNINATWHPLADGSASLIIPVEPILELAAVRYKSLFLFLGVRSSNKCRFFGGV